MFFFYFILGANAVIGILMMDGLFRLRESQQRPFHDGKKTYNNQTHTQLANSIVYLGKLIES